jgi:hypothetical protein
MLKMNQIITYVFFSSFLDCADAASVKPANSTARVFSPFLLTIT